MTDEKAATPASIPRNTALAFGAEVSAGIFTGVLTLYLVRELGPASFGVFSLALSIGALVILPADFGISQSAARFIAERRGNREPTNVVLGTALRVKLLASALVAALMFALAGPISSAYNLPELEWPLRAMAVAVLAQSLLSLFRSTFEAVGQMGRDWTMVLAESAVETTASIALVALGTGAAGAAWGRTIGYAVGLALGIVLAIRLLGSKFLRPGRLDRKLVRRLGSYGLALFFIDGAFAAFSQVDVLLVGAILGADAAGVFAAPLRFLTLALYPAAAITAGVAPRMAKTEGEGPNVPALELGLSLLVVIHLLMIAPLLVWAEPLVHLVLGPGYGEAAGVLRALTPFILLAGPARLLTTSVNYLGEARRRILIVLAALTLNIVADLILIPKVGVVGAAIGNDIGFAVYALGHLRICRQLTGLSLAPILRSLGRGLLAAAAMSLVLLVIGTGEVAAPLAVAGLLAGTAVFLATLFALREPMLAELSAWWRQRGSEA